MTGLFDAIIQLGYVWILSERATFQISLFLMIFYYYNSKIYYYFLWISIVEIDYKFV